MQDGPRQSAKLRPSRLLNADATVGSWVSMPPIPLAWEGCVIALSMLVVLRSRSANFRHALSIRLGTGS